MIAGHAEHYVFWQAERPYTPQPLTTSQPAGSGELPKLPMADFLLLSEAVVRCPTSRIALFLGLKPSL